MPNTPLAQALLIDDLRTRFPDLALTEYGREELPLVTRLKDSCMHTLGLAVWDKVVTRGIDRVDPSAMAGHINAEAPDLLRHIRNHLNKTVLRDLYYGHATVDVEGERRTVAEVLLAHVYPNDLHIADIEFSDPYAPIAEGDRRYEYTHYRGLGMLGPFLNRTEAIAREIGSELISLTAATADHVGLFGLHGFLVSDTPAARMAQRLGVSIPMIKPLG